MATSLQTSIDDLNKEYTTGRVVDKKLTFDKILRGATAINPNTGEQYYPGDPDDKEQSYEIVNKVLEDAVGSRGKDFVVDNIDSTKFPTDFFEPVHPEERTLREKSLEEGETPEERRQSSGVMGFLEEVPGVGTLIGVGSFAATTLFPLITSSITGIGQMGAPQRLKKIPKIGKDGFFDLTKGTEAYDYLVGPAHKVPINREKKDYLLNYESEVGRNETAKSEIAGINSRIARIKAGDEKGDIDALYSKKEEWEETRVNSQEILNKHEAWYDNLKYGLERQREKAVEDIIFWEDLRDSWNESFSNFIEDTETLRARKEWTENTPFTVKNLLKDPKTWIEYGIGSALPSMAIAMTAARFGGPTVGIGVMTAIGTGGYYSGHYDEYRNEAPASDDDYNASKERFSRMLQKEYEEGYDPDKFSGNLNWDLKKLLNETYREESDGSYTRLPLSREEAHEAVMNKSLIYGAAEGVLEYLPIGRYLKNAGQAGKKKVLKEAGKTAADGAKFGGKMKSPLGAATREWMKQGLFEGVTEMSQRAAEIMVSGGFLTGDLDPKLGALDWSLEKIIKDEEFWSSGWSGLWGGLVMGGGSGTAKYNNIKTINKDRKAQQRAKEVVEQYERGEITGEEANEMWDVIVAESLLGADVKKVGEGRWRSNLQDLVKRGKKWVKDKKKDVVGNPTNIFAAETRIKRNFAVLREDKQVDKKLLKKWEDKYKELSQGDLIESEFNEFLTKFDKVVKEGSGAFDRMVDENPEFMADLFPELVDGEKGIIKISTLSEKFQEEHKIGKFAPITIENTKAQMIEFALANKIKINKNSTKAVIFKSIDDEMKKKVPVEEPVAAREGAESEYIKSLVSEDKPPARVKKPISRKYTFESHIFEQQDKLDKGERILEFIAYKKNVNALEELDEKEAADADMLISDFIEVKLGKTATPEQIQEFKQMYAEGFFPKGFVKILDAKTQTRKLVIKKGEEQRFLDVWADNLPDEPSQDEALQNYQEFVNATGEGFVDNLSEDAIQNAFNPQGDDKMVFIKPKITKIGEDLPPKVTEWKGKVSDKKQSEVKKELKALDVKEIQEIINEFSEAEYNLDFTKVPGALNKDGSFNWKKKDAIVGALIYNIQQVNRLEEGVPEGEVDVKKDIDKAKVTAKLEDAKVKELMEHYDGDESAVNEVLELEKYAISDEIGYENWKHALNSVNKRRREKGEKELSKNDPDAFVSISKEEILDASKESISVKERLAAKKALETTAKKPGIRGAAALSKRVKKMPVSLVNNIIGLIKEAEASSMGFPERTGDIEQILSGEDIGAGWNHKDGDIDDVLIDKELNKLFPNKDVRRRVIEYIKETRILPAAKIIKLKNTERSVFLREINTDDPFDTTKHKWEIVDTRTGKSLMSGLTPEDVIAETEKSIAELKEQGQWKSHVEGLEADIDVTEAPTPEVTPTEAETIEVKDNRGVDGSLVPINSKITFWGPENKKIKGIFLEIVPQEYKEQTGEDYLAELEEGGPEDIGVPQETPIRIKVVDSTSPDNGKIIISNLESITSYVKPGVTPTPDEAAAFPETFREAVERVHEITKEIENLEDFGGDENKIRQLKILKESIQKFIKSEQAKPAAVAPTKTPAELEAQWAQENIEAHLRAQGMKDADVDKYKAMWMKDQLKAPVITRKPDTEPSQKGASNLNKIVQEGKEGDEQDTSNVDDLFQVTLMDKKRLITEKKDYNKILKRLQKKMPWVKSFSKSFIVKEIESNPDAFGRAAGAMVEWTEKAGLETPPHEFFHVYWGMMKGTSIQRRAMKILDKNAKDTEESLALWVGKYYVERTKASVPKKIGLWFRQFWAKMKKLFAPNKLSAEDVKHIIASEFYTGKEIAAPAIVAGEVRYHTESGTANRPFEDFFNQRDADISETNTDESGEDGIQPDRESATENNKDIRISLLHNEFSRMLGKHVKEEEFNLILEEAASQSDFKEWKKYLEENHKKKSLTKKEENNAKLTWQKMQSKVNRENISVFDLLNVDPEDGTKVLGVKRFRINRGHDPSSGKFLGKYYVKDFVQEDGLVDNLHILPLNHVLKAVEKRGEHLRDAKREGSPDKREYWLFKDNLSLTPGTIRGWDHDFALSYLKNLAEGKDKPLGAFFAPKGGDASTLFFISIDANTVKNSLDEDYVTEYWETERGDGLISEEMYEDIMTEWKIYKDKKSGKKLYRPLAMAQLMGRHETWKKIKWWSYAADAKNTQDMFDRLKLDFAQGTVPYGAGKVKTMFFDPKNVVLKMENVQGEEIDVTENLFFEGHYIGDGSIMTGGKYLQRVADVMGRDSLSVLKTVQRFRGGVDETTGEAMDPKNVFYPAYINMKGLLGIVQEGLNIYEKNEDGSEGKQIIRTGWEEVDGKRTIIIEAINEDGAWEEIDMLATPDERKQAAGEYNVLNTIKTMPENFTRVLQTPPKKSKSSATFPFQWETMFGDPVLREEVSDEMDILEDYLTKTANVYWKRLFALRTPDKNGNYSYLYNEMYRALQEGEMPGEIDRYVKMLGSSPALLHPSIIGRVVAQMRNRFIVDGAFSGRRLGGGTIAFFKPDMGGRVNDKSIIVSAENSTVFKEVEKRYSEYLKDTYNEEMFNRMEEHYMGRSFEERTEILNEFLENNEVKAFIHRVPVVDIYGAQMRRIQRLETGLQGDVTFMTHNDVFNVFQGDHDGDKININFVPTEVETALEKITSSEAYKAKQRVVKLNIFKHQVQEDILVKDKEGTVETIVRQTVMNIDGFYNMASAIASAEGAQGIMANLRSLYSNMLLRDVRLTFTHNKKSVVFKVRQSDQHIIFKEGLLDNKELQANDAALLKEIYDRGDWVVAKRGTKEKPHWARINSLSTAVNEIKSRRPKLYLETTPDHLLTIWTQAAVDNAKHMLISKWGYEGRETLFPYIFERVEGDASWKSIKKGLSSFLSLINTSQLKNGKTATGNMDASMLFKKSETLSDFADMNAKLQGEELKTNYIERVGKRKGMPQLKEVSVNGEMTTVEKVIKSLWDAKENDQNENPQHAMEWGDTPVTFKEQPIVHAHVMAVVKLAESDMVQELKKMDPESMSKGRRVGNKLAQKHADIATEKESLQKEQDLNINKLQIDRNEAVQEFIDEAYTFFNEELTPDEQKMATLQFLKGATIKTNIKGKMKYKNIHKVIQLLPLDLMHQGMVKEYLDNWGTEFAKTTEEKDNDNIPTDPKDIPEKYTSLVFTEYAVRQNKEKDCS